MALGHGLRVGQPVRALQLEALKSSCDAMPLRYLSTKSHTSMRRGIMSSETVPQNLETRKHRLKLSATGSMLSVLMCAL